MAPGLASIATRLSCTKNTIKLARIGVSRLGSTAVSLDRHRPSCLPFSSTFAHVLLLSLPQRRQTFNFDFIPDFLRVWHGLDAILQEEAVREHGEVVQHQRCASSRRIGRSASYPIRYDPSLDSAAFRRKKSGKQFPEKQQCQGTTSIIVHML